MQITLTADLGPIEQTGNENYRKGAQVDFPDRHARWLIMRDLAVAGWGAMTELRRPEDVGEFVNEGNAPAVDYPSMLVAELRKAASAAGIEGYSTMRKAELIAALEDKA